VKACALFRDRPIPPAARPWIRANHPESGAEKIRDLDTNHDGVLSVLEYSAGSQRMFDILDVDGNGVLTPSEMVLDPRSR